MLFRSYRICNAQSAVEYPVRLDDVYPGSRDIQWPRGVNKTCRSGAMLNLVQADRNKVDAAYDNIALSIAAYEGSPEVNQFSSKYDAYLAGDARLTNQEEDGLSLFDGKAMCSACHVLDLHVRQSGRAEKPRESDL